MHPSLIPPLHFLDFELGHTVYLLKTLLCLSITCWVKSCFRFTSAASSTLLPVLRSCRGSDAQVMLRVLGPPVACAHTRTHLSPALLFLLLPPYGGFPGGASGKKKKKKKTRPANAGDIRDAGSIPGSGRSPGEWHGHPLQYSWLENPMDRGS